MRKLYILEKITTGRKVKFFDGIVASGPKSGNRVMILHDIEKNKSFVIKASLNNYVRFNRWSGKEAMADYEVYPLLVSTDHGKLKTIKLSTEVEIDNYKEKNTFDHFDL